MVPVGPTDRTPLDIQTGAEAHPSPRFCVAPREDFAIHWFARAHPGPYTPYHLHTRTSFSLVEKDSTSTKERHFGHNYNARNQICSFSLVPVGL